jgi:hypothetical protein
MLLLRFRFLVLGEGMFEPNVDGAKVFGAFLVGDFIVDFLYVPSAEFLFIIELKLTRSEKLEGLASPFLTFFLGDVPSCDFATAVFLFCF